MRFNSFTLFINPHLWVGGGGYPGQVQPAGGGVPHLGYPHPPRWTWLGDTLLGRGVPHLTYPPSDLPGGKGDPLLGGTPPQVLPNHTWPGGTPAGGTPPRVPPPRVPPLDLAGGYPDWGGLPHLVQDNRWST